MRADARGEGARPAGEVGRLALRDHRQRPPRPRRASLRASSRSTATAASSALRVHWICNIGALSLAGRAAHQHAQPVDARDQRLPHPRALRAAPAGAHQHHPITAYRGAGRPNVSYLVERLVDEAAREIGIDRVELRRSATSSRRKRSRTRRRSGSTYDSGDPAGQLDDASKHSDWNGFEARRKDSAKNAASCAASAAPCSSSPRAAARRRRSRRRSSSASRATRCSMCCRARPGRGTRRCFRRSSAAGLGDRPETRSS